MSDPAPENPKSFAIPSDQLREIVPGLGACFATDMITIENRGVGYMYREEPDFDDDSGWRFFSGFESEEYIDDPDNIEVHDVNTIANYDPEIVAFLEAPVGCEFERDPDTREWFQIVDDDFDDEDEEFEDESFEDDDADGGSSDDASGDNDE